MADPSSAQEWTVGWIQSALATGELRCETVVQSYLDRITVYDDRGPRLNAILTINPRALDEATAMDRARSVGAPLGPLHCIPVILKDNYNTADLPTTAGSSVFRSLRPARDAFVVRRLREAGAIILAKANLHELAWSGTTVSSLGGQTLNPYDLTRTPGGSSGGTGAAIAANFGVIGTGSDTGQSTRSPASANNLVGLRPTRGLVSRSGIIPVSSTQDEAGPITRTVEDAARFLEVVAGYDPADPVTAFGVGRGGGYIAALSADALRGARIGLLLDFLGQDPVHAEVNAVVGEAVARMENAGATVIRIRIPEIDALTNDLSLISHEFKAAFDRYLADLGTAAPVGSLDEFMARGEFHPTLRAGLEAARARVDGLNEPDYLRKVLRRQELRQALMVAMAKDSLDAILYPHQRRLVAPIGEEQLERNGVLSNATGFPAVTFPGGFSGPTATAPLGVPVGIELLGPEWSEARLLALAYAFEQAARVRRPPASTPPLR